MKLWILLNVTQKKLYVDTELVRVLFKAEQDRQLNDRIIVKAKQISYK